MKSTAKKPAKEATLFVTRSGPRRGAPDCQAAFVTKEEAVRFLADLHGLGPDEQRALRKDLHLKLKRSIHGSEQCSITSETMSKHLAQQALSGELYLDPNSGPGIRPRKIA